MTAIQLPSWEELKWPVAASILYVSLYYVYMCLQVVGKYRARVRTRSARCSPPTAPQSPHMPTPLWPAACAGIHQGTDAMCPSSVLRRATFGPVAPAGLTRRAYVRSRRHG